MGIATDEFQAGGIGPNAIYRARALALLGIDPLSPTVGEFFDDFVASSSGTTISSLWQPTATGTATQTSPAGAGGGLGRMSTGASNSVSDISCRNGIVSNVSTAKWYVATRFRFNTVPGANTAMGVGLLNLATTKSILAGWFSGIGGANFMVQYDGQFAGAAINLGVALDTGFHIVEIYALGNTTLRVRIDGGAELTAVMAAAPADYCFQWATARNGAAAGDQSQDLDWYYSMFGRI